MSRNCDAKRFYDTEWEAERAASIAEHDFGAPMVWYKHGTHWHIGNKIKNLQSKRRTFRQAYCKACDVFMRPSHFKAHQEKPGHLRNVDKEKAA